MKKYTLCWVALFFLMACGSDKIVIPEGVLKEDKMVAVLADIQITEASIMHKIGKGNYNGSNTPKYYQYIFNKNKITEEEFRRSFNFYVGQVDLMNKIYEEVITEISKRQAEVANK